MKKNIKLYLSCVLIPVILLAGCGKNNGSNAPAATATPTATTTVEATPTETPTVSVTPAPTKYVDRCPDQYLKTRYEGIFRIGVALPRAEFAKTNHMELVKQQFNSFTYENEMKPDAMLLQTSCQNGLPGTYTEPVLNLKGLDSGLTFAQKNGFGMRGHTLCWYSQTPKWFFTEDYTSTGALVSKEVMMARLESYIRQIMTYCQENYPGVIYAWDVVNEAVDHGTGDEHGIRKGNNKWYETIGPEFIECAFRYARKYSDGTADLYYNDYGCAGKKETIVKVLQPILDAGNIDGIGMQCHISTGDNIENTVYKTAKYFADKGYKVEITELDIANSVKTDSGEKKQARKYKMLFQLMEQAKLKGEIDIDSITVWGLYDSISWKSTDKPLLFRARMNDLEKKYAWYGAMQDPEIEASEW